MEKNLEVRTWTYTICETCSKNAHETHKMRKEKILVDHPEKREVEMWICPNCGASKGL